MSKEAIKIAVLMAVKNGLAYLPQQIDSILKQQDCLVTLFVSDDGSTDGSLEYLQKLAMENSTIKLLPKADPLGSAALNFYRLICDTNTDGFDFFALSDQDDIWLPDKLSRHATIVKEQGASGVSSNVLAFWPSGNIQLLDKAQPQREFDYLFGSGGAGCTLLLSPQLFEKVREHLLDETSPAKETALHDWLIYAICRANDWRWIIDPSPSVHYRQHHNNDFGANVGIAAKWSRLLKLKQHWYRNEVIKMAKICYAITARTNISQLLELLEHKSFVNQLKLLRYVPQARRKTFDRLMLAGAILLGVF